MRKWSKSRFCNVEARILLADLTVALCAATQKTNTTQVEEKLHTCHTAARIYLAAALTRVSLTLILSAPTAAPDVLCPWVDGAAPRSRRGGGLRGGLCRLLLGSRCENGREGAVLEQLEGGVLLALLESGDGELDGALLRVRGRSGQGQVRPGQARSGQGKVRVRSHPNKQEQARHIKSARPGDVRFWWQRNPIGSSRRISADLGGSRALTETSLTHARRLFLPSPKKRAIRPPSGPAMRSYVRKYASLGAGRRRCAVYCSSA